MSRCFPFPPPGYEKKIRTDEPDFLIKENQKEKKHKKHKKDKEKKDRKEKKDKETSKDKHKERKEKKEKRKDRKNKDRDREKSRTSEDKKASAVLSNTDDKEKLVTCTLQNNGNGESKFVQDLARRIRDEEEATGSQSARKISLPCGDTKNNISYPVPQTNHRNDDEKRINTHRNFVMEKRLEKPVQVSSSTDQNGTEVMVKPVEKKEEAKEKELQGKNHRRENAKKSDNLLDNAGIRKSEVKNITDRSSKEKTEVINKTGQERPKFVEGGPRLKERETESVDIRKVKMQDLSRVGVKNLTANGILGKRKDLDTNELMDKNGSRPNKIQRPVASPISSVENGRMGASQTPPKPTSELQGIVCNPEVKDHRINGFIDSKELPKTRPPVSSVKVKENSEESSKKRPHPDLKYLDQILNVPKRAEVDNDDDEQEWLFGQPGIKLVKKQTTDSTSSLDETQQVWNQALKIESADIVALPYVVPF